MNVYSIASGSRGNATVVEHGGCQLMIDCGLPLKTLKAGFVRCGLWREGDAPPPVAGVLVTHSHDDHVKGLHVLAHHLDAPVFANALTAETVMHDCELDEDVFACFENGQTFEVGPFSVEAFSIPHDTSDPVGYLVRAGGETYFHGTDIGTPLAPIGAKLAQADVALLESNHDAVLLGQSGRPRAVIARIAGPRGHLSNDDACDLVRRFASPRLKRLALAHLSHDCNAPHLAEGAMRETLSEMGRDDVALKVLRQDDVVTL